MSTLDALLVVNHVIRYLLTHSDMGLDSLASVEALGSMLKIQDELEHDLIMGNGYGSN